MQSSLLRILLFISGLILLILLNISLYDIDFIPVIIAKDLNIPSSDLKGILNIDLNLARYIINASGTLYGWPILPLLFSSSRRSLSFMNDRSVRYSILSTSDSLYFSHLLFDPIQYLFILLFLRC